MSRTPFQIRLARLFLSMPEAEGFALAGGAPLIFRRMIARSTNIGFDYRLQPPESTAIGPALTAQELAADKLLALFSRAEARDFVDVYLLAQRFGVQAMLDWARQKDAGFDPYVLATMLGKFDAVPRREFEFDEGTYEQLRRFFEALRASLIGRTLMHPHQPRTDE